jgi:hypothetical protein
MHPLLVTILTLLLAVSVGSGQAPVDAVAVKGAAELTPAAAHASARAAVDAHARLLWRERGERIAQELRPAWIPSAVCDRTVERFLGDRDLSGAMRVVDREDRAREHEFGSSWQTTLWVAEDEQAVEAGERGLRAALADLRGQALAFLAGASLWWGLLAFLVGWLDRLSRGYMTARLSAIGVALGVSVPSLAFLL